LPRLRPPPSEGFVGRGRPEWGPRKKTFAVLCLPEFWPRKQGSWISGCRLGWFCRLGREQRRARWLHFSGYRLWFRAGMYGRTSRSRPPADPVRSPTPGGLICEQPPSCRVDKSVSNVGPIATPRPASIGNVRDTLCPVLLSQSRYKSLRSSLGCETPLLVPFSVEATRNFQLLPAEPSLVPPQCRAGRKDLAPLIGLPLD